MVTSSGKRRRSAGRRLSGRAVIAAARSWKAEREQPTGQGSAPIAHAAAKTDEPVSEGVVALLEPFIDTIVICTMTGMVIIMTGVWNDRVSTEMALSSGDISYRAEFEDGRIRAVPAPAEIVVQEGRPVALGDDARLSWHEVPVEQFYVDAAQTVPFTGVIRPAQGTAVAADGTTYSRLWGDAVETGAPLTALGFQRGLPGEWGNYIVLISVLLFAISTAISWSYYGDRCANYLFGPKAILPYKMAFVLLHFVGAVLPLTVIWDLGDVFLGMVIIPNLIAVIVLSPKVVAMTKSYFERKPWIANEEAHRRYVEDRKAGRRK